MIQRQTEFQCQVVNWGRLAIQRWLGVEIQVDFLTNPRNHGGQSGFSLIELLVVIFIIGVLTAVLLPNFMGFRKRARDSRKKQQLMEAKKALRLYYNDHQYYPATASAPSKGGQFSVGGEVYMKDFPEYDVYVSCDGGERFVLTIVLENAADGDISESQARCSQSISSCSVAPAVDHFVVCED